MTSPVQAVCFTVMALWVSSLAHRLSDWAWALGRIIRITLCVEELPNSKSTLHPSHSYPSCRVHCYTSYG